MPRGRSTRRIRRRPATHHRSPSVGLRASSRRSERCLRVPLTVERKSATFFRPSKGKGTMAPDRRDDLLQGTLDMLVLKALQLGPLHGWGITERLDQGSANVLRVGQGSLYPALYRLEKQG